MLIKFKIFLRRLRRSLTSKKRYRQLQGGVAKPEGKGFGRCDWVLSRPLYRFARFEFKSVTKLQREQALALRIRQWAPHTETGSYVLWDQDNAQVWAWDARGVQAEILANKLQPKSTTIVPETVLHSRHQQGVYLVACMDGYEGQVWLNGTMNSSRWWQELPAIEEWINFQRDAGVLPENRSNEVPPVLRLSLNQDPWARSASLNGSSFYGGNTEQSIVATLILCLFAASMWYGTQLIKLNGEIRNQGKELEALNQQAAPIVDARGKAMEALGRVKMLLSLDPYPDQLGLLAKVAESLSNDGAYLKEWEFQNGKLKVQITSPKKIMSSDYIKLFESLEIFKNVQAAPTTDPTSLVLNMEVASQPAIKFAASSDQSAKSIGVVTPLR